MSASLFIGIQTQKLKSRCPNGHFPDNYRAKFCEICGSELKKTRLVELLFADGFYYYHLVGHFVGRTLSTSSIERDMSKQWKEAVEELKNAGYDTGDMKLFLVNDSSMI